MLYGEMQSRGKEEAEDSTEMDMDTATRCRIASEGSSMLISRPQNMRTWESTLFEKYTL